MSSSSSNSMTTTRYRLLSVADATIALLLTFPLTCMYWRGIWDLIGWYVLPEMKPANSWLHACVGLLQMVGLLCLPLVSKSLDSARPVCFWVGTRVFMYVHTLTYMFYWRGVWELLNYYFSPAWQYNVGTLGVAWLSLVMLGGCRSTMWPPFFILCDTPELFQCANRFGTKPKRGAMLDYLSDSFITQIVVLGIAIVCWRSAFNIIDGLIYPNLQPKPDLVSALIGLCGCVALLCLQVALSRGSVVLRASPFLRTLYEDLVHLVAFAFLSLLWRGVWNLNTEYLVKALPLGGWVNHVAGTAGLMAMQTFGEVSAFGMLHDTAERPGQVFFPLHYLRYYLRQWCADGQSQDTSQKADACSEIYTNDACVETSSNHSQSYSLTQFSSSSQVAFISKTEVDPDPQLGSTHTQAFFGQSGNTQRF